MLYFISIFFISRYFFIGFSIYVFKTVFLVLNIFSRKHSTVFLIQTFLQKMVDLFQGFLTLFLLWLKPMDKSLHTRMMLCVHETHCELSALSCIPTLRNRRKESKTGNDLRVEEMGMQSRFAKPYAKIVPLIHTTQTAQLIFILPREIFQAAKYRRLCITLVCIGSVDVQAVLPQAYFLAWHSAAGRQR